MSSVSQSVSIPQPSQTYSRGADGCVVCPTSVACPTCAEDENCVLTALTCDTCPYTYCAKKSSLAIGSLSGVDANGNALNATNSSGSSTNSHKGRVNIPGIVSGSVVGFLVLVLVLVIVYFWKRRKRFAREGKLRAYKLSRGRRGPNRVGGKNSGDGEDGGDGAGGDGIKWDSDIENELDDDDLDLDIDDDDDEEDDDDDEDDEDDIDDGAGPRHLYAAQPHMRQRLEDIVEEGDDMNVSGPVGLDALRNGQTVEQFRLRPMRPLKAASDAQSIYSNNTVHTKASSNVLPIAYIPGVTINQMQPHVKPGYRPHSRAVRGRLNHDDVRSHITLGSSILGSEDNFDLEFDHSVTPVPVKPEMEKAEKPATNLTTAIRAKPRLITIDGKDPQDASEGTPEETQDVQVPEQHDDVHSSGSSTESFTIDLDISLPEDESPFGDQHQIVN